MFFSQNRCYLTGYYFFLLNGYILEFMNTKQTNKNIIICLDGTGNQFGKNNSNIIKLYRMLKRVPGKQVTYYDPGVGTMGDPLYKTTIARKVTQVLGLAFGRGLMKNVMEAYTFLMEQYEDGDKVFIFGFSRGAYTARVLAAFIKEYGLLEKGANNLFPYAIKLFLGKAPKDKKDKETFYSERSKFRSTYGRLLNHKEDPRDLKSNKIPNYQLRIHFLGLFDTVKSYGWIWNQLILGNEEENKSVLNVRHAISIDEKRTFFNQMHWKASKNHQTCKEVWFAGSHSDVGGGYPEHKSGLAKITLEWMVHEAISLGMKVDLKRYSLTLLKKLEDKEWKDLPSVIENDEIKFSCPDPKAAINESLEGAWKLVQLLPKKLELWKEHKGIRTIKSQHERLETGKDLNPFLVHQSVVERIADKKMKYQPKNIKSQQTANGNFNEENIEKTISTQDVFNNNF